MYENSRKNEILEILEANGYMSVQALAKKLNISMSSIRRDLAALQATGKITRRYGGVELNSSSPHNVPFESRYYENNREKKRIAKAAAKLINPGDVIMIDNSSTSLYLYDELANIKDLTVITNSIFGLEKMITMQVKAICTGGILNSENRGSLIGTIAEENVDQLYADWYFFSNYSIDDDGIITDAYIDENTLSKHMLKHSKKSVFLCDSSKLGTRSSYVLASLEKIDYMVCDIHLPKLAEKFPNVTFICAEKT